METTGKTILNQLGGARFVAMTGAKSLMDLGNGLKFQLGRGARDGITHVCIVLDDATDTYTVSLYRITGRGLDVTPKGEEFGIYADQLRELIESRTGFLLTL